jgi:hypothetical protein
MKLINSFVFALIALLIVSCNKSNDDASGTGDAIIISKKLGANVVYGYSLYAYTFASFQSVKVTSTIDATKTYTLKENQGYKTNFYYETPDADFTTVKPVAATFSFSAVFNNGATDVFQDELTDKVLPVPVIEKTESGTDDKDVTITWALVTGADSYGINILEGTTVVFASLELVNTTKTLTVASTASGWITGFTPEAGKTYTVRLNAYLYEPSGNSYNLQAVSTTEKSIIWGN